MNTRMTYAVSLALSGLITAGLAVAAFAPLSPVRTAKVAVPAPAVVALQRLPTIVVTPDMQVMPEVVVVANPADYEIDDERSLLASDIVAPVRALGGEMVRQAAFDMPYYSFAKAPTRNAKE